MKISFIKKEVYNTTQNVIGNPNVVDDGEDSYKLYLVNLSKETKRIGNVSLHHKRNKYTDGKNNIGELQISLNRAKDDTGITSTKVLQLFNSEDLLKELLNRKIEIHIISDSVIEDKP